MHRSLVTLDDALSKVGITVEDVLAQGGSILDAGAAYLVGSLAQGFGNRGSDVDIQMFVPDIDRPTPAFLCFVGEVPIDIEHFPDKMPLCLAGRLEDDAATTGLGTVALGSSLDGDEIWSLTRWGTALPVKPDLPPLLSDEALLRLEPHLLRSALKRLVLTWAQAELVTRADRDAGHMWAMCRRAVFDVLCTTEGHPPIGEKWLAARVRRTGLRTDLLRRVEEIHDTEGMAKLMEGLGLPLPDPLTLARLIRDPDLEEVRIGSFNRYLLTRQGEMLEETVLPVGTSADVITEVPAADIADHLRRGRLLQEVDDAALNKALVA
ncbi:MULTISPECIES: hypothetical protein [Streptomyces]|uniref:hypothetical protein n=1 Tax=Streptomyces TaxID=1883 RepID=UPI00367D959D